MEGREAAKLGCPAPARQISGVLERLRALSRPDSTFEARVRHALPYLPECCAPTCHLRAIVPQSHWYVRSMYVHVCALPRWVSGTVSQSACT